ncbi:thymidine kinase, cytosolic isoform X1 [Myiozetetes cayanensis]|uniref:thymidine kinase, cytosolic isoform X1 n=1 Tax=Myiozetetes cayanensis TaxID=478635 RepID=UPI00215E4C88|nr:thymidine kinase, cytosolic isoform X1 [Myiozetetes cayanensis]
MNCLTVPGVHPGSPSRPRGQIQVIFGPMFSGKSTELMRRVRRFQLAQYRCLLVKYAKDTRYSSCGVSTHDKSTMEAVPAELLQDVYQEALGAAVIGIDEGQFFPDIVEFCETMANTGKTVIVAALDGTFQRKAFGSILNLVPLAESVVKLNAVCMECFREASYTKRLGAEREVSSLGTETASPFQSCWSRGIPSGKLDSAESPSEFPCQVEVIGGADKYHSVCRACYFRKRPQQPGLENKENVPLALRQQEAAAIRKIFT